MVTKTRRRIEEAVGATIAPRLIFADAVYEKNEFLARTGITEETFVQLRQDHGLRTVRLGNATAVAGDEYHRVIRALMEKQTT